MLHFEVRHKWKPCQGRNGGETPHCQNRHEGVLDPRPHGAPPQYEHRHEREAPVGDDGDGGDGVRDGHEPGHEAVPRVRVPPRRDGPAGGELPDDAADAGGVGEDEEGVDGVAVAALEGDADHGDADGRLDQRRADQVADLPPHVVLERARLVGQERAELGVGRAEAVAGAEHGVGAGSGRSGGQRCFLSGTGGNILGDGLQDPESTYTA